MHYLYKITNLLNNKVYIGQSNKKNERWRQHKYFAKQEKPVQYISRAIKKYGCDNFIYEVIAQCILQEDADEIEKQLIVQYNSRDKERGYNISPGGDIAWNRGLPKEQQPMYGKSQSDYFKQRMSEVHSGKTVIVSQQTKDKMSNNRKGKTKSAEWKQKIGDAHRGKQVSDETKHKISEAHLDKTLSEIHKNNISAAMLGKNSGEKSHLAKLNWESVRQIRKEYAIGNISQAKLAKKYNVSQDNISNIIRNKTWKE